jgi:hypothetical protein
MTYQSGSLQITAILGTEHVYVDNGSPTGTWVLASAFWMLPPGQLFVESSATGLTAHAGGGQAGALPLTSELNRVSTVASPGDSVVLPASVGGLTIIVENAGANSMQVFGLGTDTINGVASGTGVSQMSSSVAIYTCYAAGSWFVNGLGSGYSGSFQTQSTATGITAYAAGGQGSATPLTAMVNNVTTAAAANASVVLPASAVGLYITVVNNGANSINVFCPAGSTMNGTANGSSALAAGAVGIYYCVTGTAWVSK